MKNYSIPCVLCGPHAPGVTIPPGRIATILGGPWYGMTIALTSGGEAYIVGFSRTASVRVERDIRVGDTLADINPLDAWLSWFVPVETLPAPTGRRVTHPGYTPGECQVAREQEGRAKMEKSWDALWASSQPNND